MIITFIVCLIAVLVTIYTDYKNNPKTGILFSFIIVFIFLALRYDFGNDYLSYQNYYQEVQNATYKQLFGFDTQPAAQFMEIGYSLLNKLLPSFYILVACVSLLWVYVFYNNIRIFGLPTFIWFSLFILLFDPNLMLVHISAIRQTISVCLFLFSIKFLFKRDFVKYIVIVLVASLFHKSALILIPVYFVTTPSKWSKAVLISLVGFFIFEVFLGYRVLEVINNIIGIYFPRYREEYINISRTANLNTGLGFLFYSFVFFFIVWAHEKSEKFYIVITKVTIIGFLLYPLGLYLSVFGRIGYYFIPTTILSIPYAISLLKSFQLKFIIILFFMIFYFYSFFSFFKNPIWAEKYSVYKINIFQ